MVRIKEMKQASKSKSKRLATMGELMKITVKLFATLRIGREKIMDLDVEETSCVSDIVNLLELPAGEVAIIMINGRGAELDSQLSENDTLALFPPVGGG